MLVQHVAAIQPNPNTTPECSNLVAAIMQNIIIMHYRNFRSCKVKLKFL